MAKVKDYWSITGWGFGFRYSRVLKSPLVDVETSTPVGCELVRCQAAYAFVPTIWIVISPLPDYEEEAYFIDAEEKFDTNYYLFSKFVGVNSS